MTRLQTPPIAVSMPSMLFRSTIADLLERGRPVMLQMRTARLKNSIVLLASRSPNPDTLRIENRLSVISRSDMEVEFTNTVGAELCLGSESLRGQLWGRFRNRHGWVEPIPRLFLPGSGMHGIDMDLPVALFPRAAQSAAPDPDSLVPERWSRTAGALQPHPWHRLTRLSVAVVGCGRTGSLIAEQMARLGIEQLTLIDPDIVSLSNLGEMMCATEKDVGSPKVLALRNSLMLIRPELELRTFHCPVNHSAAVEALKECDVIIACPDNDTPRLACAVLSVRYSKVLIDIGTGIQFEPSTDSTATTTLPTRRMGADLRLMVPGDGCLLCVGSMGNPGAALTELAHFGEPNLSETQWRRQRAGSLRSLNMISAGLAVTLLQDLVSERVRQSTWLHLDFDANGRLSVQYPTRNPAATSCSLCAFSGLGDLHSALP